MKFISTRIITADVKRLVDFYEMVTEVSAVWGNELFAEIPTPVGTLAIGSDKTVPLFGDGSAEPAANRSAILEFIVEDVGPGTRRLARRLKIRNFGHRFEPWAHGNDIVVFKRLVVKFRVFHEKRAIRQIALEFGLGSIAHVLAKGDQQVVALSPFVILRSAES